MKDKIDQIIIKAVNGNKQLTDYEKGYFDGWHDTEFGEEVRE